MSEKANALERRVDALASRIGPWPADVAPLSPVTTTGIKTLSASPQQIPGGVIAGTEKYDIDAAGSFSTGSPAPTGMTFSVYYGTTGTGTDIGDLVLPAAGLPVSISGASWKLHAEVAWVSATSVRCSIVLHWRTAGGISNSVAYHQSTTTGGIDTTAAHSLVLAFAFTGTGVTLNTDYCHMSRRG